MRILFVAKQSRNVATFLRTLRLLAERGHTVLLATQDRDDERDKRLEFAIDVPGVSILTCPSTRLDEWAAPADLARRLRDGLRYVRPPFRSGTKLQARIMDRLRQDLLLDVAGGQRLTHLLNDLDQSAAARLESIMALAEHGLPRAPVFDQFLANAKPDVLLLSPLIHFGAGQADLVLSAQQAGIPVGMLLFSWDNLSTKGCLHRHPDRMFVWNERQRDEAATLHGFPADAVEVVGAPRFDRFFELTPSITREAFFQPLGLDPARPGLLYLCSSRLIAEREADFITRWIGAIRGSASRLRDCNIVIRPHPDVPNPFGELPLTRHVWTEAQGLPGHIGRPLPSDNRVVLLKTATGVETGLYESIHHCHAVVGLNTTAELEAGIVGRPVFSIQPDRDQGEAGHTPTVHFHYLTREHGGFVSVAASLDQHVAQLERALDQDVESAPITSFVQAFLRPHGIATPVSPLLANAIERFAAGVASTDRASGAELAQRAPLPQPAPIPVHVETSATPTLTFEHAGNRLRVHVTPSLAPHLRGEELALNKVTLEWLDRHVMAGEVVYDIGAGVGLYSLIAAKVRGAHVVAFEAGYAAYADLCNNLLLNECHGSVAPLPLVLSNRVALGEIKFRVGHPGEEIYALQKDSWRARLPLAGRPYFAPVVVSTLDTSISQLGLPLPHHVRFSRRASVLDVLAGGASTLAKSVKSLSVHAEDGAEPELARRLEELGWVPISRSGTERSAQLVMARVTQPA